MRGREEGKKGKRYMSARAYAEIKFARDHCDTTIRRPAAAQQPPSSTSASVVTIPIPHQYSQPGPAPPSPDRPARIRWRLRRATIMGGPTAGGAADWRGVPCKPVRAAARSAPRKPDAVHSQTQAWEAPRPAGVWSGLTATHRLTHLGDLAQRKIRFYFMRAKSKDKKVKEKV